MFLHVSWLKLMNETSFSLTRLSWPLGSTKWCSNPSWLVVWGFHSREFSGTPKYDTLVSYPIMSPSGWWFQFSTPLKNMSSSVGMIIPYIMENKKCSKPPTSHYIANTPHIYPYIPLILSGWWFRHVGKPIRKCSSYQQLIPVVFFWNNIGPTVEARFSSAKDVPHFGLLPFWDDPSISCLKKKKNVHPLFHDVLWYAKTSRSSTHGVYKPSYHWGYNL